MASGTPPLASRYDGLGVGPRHSYTYENQAGVPVDGTNATVRAYSPFTLQIIPPDPLGTTSTGASNVLSFSAAAASAGSNNASATATGLLTAYQGSTYVAAQLREAASAPRPPGMGLPPQSILADAYTAADIRVQRDLMSRMPSLTLLVNPTEMTRTFDRIASYQSRTRSGYVYQVWGEQLVKVTFSGSTGGFVAGSNRGYQGQVERDTGSPSGYQWGSRKDSAAWQNFAALVQFYRNNGYVYDVLGRSEAHLMIGAIRIEYDDLVYEGHIENMNFSFDEGSPHRVTFDMEFTASHIYDVSPASGNVAPMAQPTSDVGSAGVRDASIYVADKLGVGDTTWSAPTPATATSFAYRERSTPPLGD